MRVPTIRILAPLLATLLALSEFGTADAAGVHGTIYLYNAETEETEPVAGRYRVEARVKGQRMKTVSNHDGTYRFYMGRRGEGEITLTHRGQRLTAAFRSRNYELNYDLYIQYHEDRFRLVARSVRVPIPRRNSPE